MTDCPDLPAPPIPPDADLKDFPFTPIYRARLFGSSFHARSTDSEWRAGFTLWLKSQDQVPAGSLPDDDIDLCRLAELGRDLKEWRKVRPGALHGWYLCNDGRLYHPVITEVVAEQLVGKQRRQWLTYCARSKKQANRRDVKFTSPTFEEWLSQGQAIDVTGTMPTCPGDKPATSPGQPGDNGSKGQGKGKGKGQGDSDSGSPGTDVPSEPGKRALSRAALFEAWWRVYPHKVGKGAAQAKFDIAIKGGVELDHLIAGVERYTRTKPADHPWMNPATWLFQKRWLDEPAPTLVVADGASAHQAPEELTPEQLYRGRLNHLRDKGRWYPERWGPPPEDPQCQAPLDLLVEYGHREKAAAA